MPGAGRYKSLLERDADLRRWYDNLAAGSRITADTHLRQLGLVCKWWGTDPQGILKLAREGTVQTKLEDEVRRLEREGYAGDYIQHVIRAVTSWMNYNGLKLFRKIKVANSTINPTIQDERVPEKEELSRIFRSLDLRGRAIAAMIAFAGLRIETIGNYDGSDGLIISDLPELNIEGDKVKIIKRPMMVKVRATLSKHRRPYFTFLAGEGCDYLQEYLESRLRAGERLEPHDPVFGHKSARARRRFLWATKIGAILRGNPKSKTGIRGAGFSWRPYVLRAYCDTAFDIAEAKGLISHPWRQFFMGHKGDIEARYSTNKGRLPSDMVEEMREAYRRCEPYLQTIQTSGVEDPQITTLRTMVESGVLDLSKPNVRQYLIQKLGIKDMEVKVAKMKDSGFDEDSAFTRIICEELGIEPMKIYKPKENNDPKKIIGENELEHYLAEGWDVQTVLPSGKILIRKVM